MHVARGVAPGLWGSHASGGSEIESILQNRQSTVLPFVMNLQDQTYFRSICEMTVPEDDLKESLYRLSRFLAKKFCQNVIILIDEYEAPIIRAYDDGYFTNVCFLYIPLYDRWG